MRKTAKKTTPDKPRKTKNKIAVWILITAAVLVLTALLSIPAVLSTEKARLLILAKINKSIAGQVDFDDFSMSWRKGIKIENVSFDNGSRNPVKIRQVRIKPHYSSILTKHRLKARIWFDKADYMGLNIGPAELKLQVKGQILTIESFSSAVNNGQLNFAGQVDFRQEPAIFKMSEPMYIVKNVRINDEMTRKLLMYINPVFANAVNIKAVADFHCEKLVLPLANDRKNDIEITGTIAVKNLHLETSDLLAMIISAAKINAPAQGITISPTRFVLRNGYVSYDNMQMVIGDNPVNFSGVIGLDKTLDMQVMLPYTMEGRTVKLNEQISRQRITLPIKGTIDKPELDFGKMIEQQLKEQLQNQIRKGLEELFK